MSEFEWLFEEVGSGVRALVERFMEMPYFFYSEQDMHAYLYHKLISGKLGEFFVETHFGILMRLRPVDSNSLLYIEAHGSSTTCGRSYGSLIDLPFSQSSEDSFLQ